MAEEFVTDPDAEAQMTKRGYAKFVEAWKENPSLLQDMMTYLSSQGSVPTISASPEMMDTQFDGLYNPSSRPASIDVRPNAMPGVLLHELVHAVQHTADKQLNRLVNKVIIPEKTRQDILNLLFPRDDSFKLIGSSSPNFINFHRNDIDFLTEYRLTPWELPAWGVQGTTAGTVAEPSGHLNPTMASNFSIAIDLLNRLSQKGNQ